MGSATLIDHPAACLIGFEGAFGSVSAVQVLEEGQLCVACTCIKKRQGAPVQCHLAVEAIQRRAGTTATQG